MCFLSRLGLGQPPVDLKDFDKVDLTGVKIGIDWTYFKVCGNLYACIVHS